MTMNIKEAKEQIKNAMTAYFTKDEFGSYAVPVEKQRPVFLMGPPGIGKTAIMEQIAQELDVCLVSYSMTHHTRQSALGLPFIEKKVFNRKEYQVSEYTMSEIIASVYETMEATGKKEGILFLDEINCVSETLAPSMLQFLQYKIFGRHRVPEGWIVVTAGNPPEYNRSVREFDIVTWDRLKRIDVEPDFDAWKEFAYQKHVHPAVMTYLEIRKGDFYKVESTVNGKRFVTARGWDDLSQMIHLYEQNHLPVDEKLIIQYLQNPKIAKEFAVYYDLFNKYRSDYQVDKILAGKATKAIRQRASAAKFDERLSLLGLLLDAAKEVTDPRVKFLIWGDGDQRAALEQRVREEEISNVVFKGKVEKKYIPSIVSRADINLIHGGDQGKELFRFGISPNKMFDCFAAGRPILMDLPAKYNPVEQFQAGICLSSVSEIPAAIRQIQVLSPQAYESLCGNARKAAARFDFRVLTQELMEILEKRG